MKRLMAPSQKETSVESSVSDTFINVILLMGKKNNTLLNITDVFKNAKSR